MCIYIRIYIYVYVSFLCIKYYVFRQCKLQSAPRAFECTSQKRFSSYRWRDMTVSVPECPISSYSINCDWIYWCNQAISVTAFIQHFFINVIFKIWKFSLMWDTEMIWPNHLTSSFASNEISQYNDCLIHWLINSMIYIYIQTYMYIHMYIHIYTSGPCAQAPSKKYIGG